MYSIILWFPIVKILVLLKYSQEILSFNVEQKREKNDNSTNFKWSHKTVNISCEFSENLLKNSTQNFKRGWRAIMTSAKKL